MARSNWIIIIDTFNHLWGARTQLKNTHKCVVRVIFFHSTDASRDERDETFFPHPVSNKYNNNNNNVGANFLCTLRSEII